MPFCSNCGTQNPDTAKFCVNCGAAMQSPISEPKPTPVTTASLIGSKVSFTASDGKTYTGTVKDIQGDQFKIKYDAFDFETWLGKNQFTIIDGNVVPAAITQALNAPTTFSGPPASATPAFLTHLGFWGSLMIIVGFFTDWMNLGYLGSITGLKILTSAGELIDSPDKDGIGLFMVITIAVVIISALICFLYSIGVGLGKGAFSFFKLLPLLAIIAFVAYVIIRTNDNSGDYETESSGSAWRLLGIGIYLTLVGSLILAISKSRK